jgi:hypothetical protein
MTNARLRARLLRTLLLAMFATGAHGETSASANTDGPRRSTCDHEARLLSNSARVYSAPGNRRVITTLRKGAAVYRCERRGAWLGIMYVLPGEKADCSLRHKSRPCRLGWIRHPAPIESAG